MRIDRRLPNLHQVISYRFLVSWIILLFRPLVGLEIFFVNKRSVSIKFVNRCSCLMMLLERVQRKAARFYLQNYNRTASITDMLRELEWDTLKMRRKKDRLLSLMYKLSHSLVDIKTRTRRTHALKYRSSLFSLDPYVVGILCLQRL